MRCIHCRSSKGFGSEETGKKHGAKREKPPPPISNKKALESMVTTVSDQIHDELLMRDVRGRASSLNQRTVASAFSQTTSSIIAKAFGKGQEPRPMFTATEAQPREQGQEESGSASGFSFSSDFIPGKRHVPRPRVPVEPNSVLDDILGNVTPHSETVVAGFSDSLLPDDILSELMSQVEETYNKPNTINTAETDMSSFLPVEGDVEPERQEDRSKEAASLINSLLMKILASKGIPPEEKVQFAQELTKINELLFTK